MAIQIREHDATAGAAAQAIDNPQAHAALDAERAVVEALGGGCQTPIWDLLEIGRPDLDWVKLANAQGVRASRAATLDDLARHCRTALRERGPYLIEVML